MNKRATMSSEKAATDELHRRILTSLNARRKEHEAVLAKAHAEVEVLETKIKRARDRAYWAASELSRTEGAIKALVSHPVLAGAPLAPEVQEAIEHPTPVRVSARAVGRLKLVPSTTKPTAWSDDPNASLSSRIRDYVAAHPRASAEQIREALDITDRQRHSLFGLIRQQVWGGHLRVEKIPHPHGAHRNGGRLTVNVYTRIRPGSP